MGLRRFSRVLRVSSGSRTGKKALEILKRDYHVEMTLDGSMNFAQTAGGKGDLQVWFENDKLTRVKLFPR